MRGWPDVADDDAFFNSPYNGGLRRYQSPRLPAPVFVMARRAFGWSRGHRGW
jgi:hypothetical protein